MLFYSVYNFFECFYFILRTRKLRVLEEVICFYLIFLRFGEVKIVVTVMVGLFFVWMVR